MIQIIPRHCNEKRWRDWRHYSRLVSERAKQEQESDDGEKRKKKKKKKK